MSTQHDTRHGGKAYDFTLIIPGVHEITEDLERAVYGSGCCDDALLSVSGGTLRIDFSREADSLLDAVQSAIEQVEAADARLRVDRVQPEDLVTAAEIARRTNRSRESVRQLITGERGNGGFPEPFAEVGPKSPLWLWSDVFEWCSANGIAISAANSESVSAINAALLLRRAATPGSLRPFIGKMLRDLCDEKPSTGDACGLRPIALRPTEGHRGFWARISTAESVGFVQV